MKLVEYDKNNLTETRVEYNLVESGARGPGGPQEYIYATDEIEFLFEEESPTITPVKNGRYILSDAAAFAAYILLLDSTNLAGGNVFQLRMDGSWTGAKTVKVGATYIKFNHVLLIQYLGSDFYQNVGHSRNSQESNGITFANAISRTNPAATMADIGDGSGSAIIPRTSEEVTAALALLPAGSFLLSSVITVPPFVDPPVIDSTSLGTVITVSVDSSGQDSVNLYYSDTSPVTTGDTKLTGITSPVDVTGLVKGGRYYFAATGVIGAVEGALTAEVEGVTNEITDTEVFDGALWTVSNLTVSNNQITAPDGTLTGALITDASVAEAGSCGQQFALVAGDELQERTGSCYYKWDGVSAEAMLEFYYLTGGALIFERVIISWNAGIPTVDNGTLEDAGDGWYRVGVSLANNNSGNTFCLLRVYATENVKPDTGSVYVWGAQVVKGSVAGEYTVRDAL